MRKVVILGENIKTKNQKYSQNVNKKNENLHRNVEKLEKTQNWKVLLEKHTEKVGWNINCDWAHCIGVPTLFC